MEASLLLARCLAAAAASVGVGIGRRGPAGTVHPTLAVGATQTEAAVGHLAAAAVQAGELVHGPLEGQPILGGQLELVRGDVHGREDGSQSDRRRLSSNEGVVDDGQLGEVLGHVGDGPADGAGDRLAWQEEEQMLDEGEGGGRAETPLQGVEDGPLHVLNVLGGEAAAAEVDDGDGGQDLVIVELGRHVQAREAYELELPPAEGGGRVVQRAQVSVEVGYGHGDDLARHGKGVGHLEEPLGDLGPPVLQRRDEGLSPSAQDGAVQIELVDAGGTHGALLMSAAGHRGARGRGASSSTSTSSSARRLDGRRGDLVGLGGGGDFRG